MKNGALKFAGALFLLMSLAQLTRLLLKVKVIAGTIEIPLWLSGVAFVVLASLSIWMFKASKE